MISTPNLEKLNDRLKWWQSKPRFPFLTWGLVGLGGTATGINQWPPCLSLGNIIGLGLFGAIAISSGTFAIIRSRMIRHYEKKIANYPF